MNSNTIIIVLIVILIIFYITNTNKQDTFRNLDNTNYGSVDYNTRMDNGVETVIPSIQNVCKDKRVNMNNDDVREKYLAKNIKLNQTIPQPNNIENIINVVDDNTNNNRHDINLYDNDLYDNLVDIKSLNSINSNEEFNTLNDIDDELLTIN